MIRKLAALRIAVHPATLLRGVIRRISKSTYMEEPQLKTLLVYSSRTGNTRKVAEAILEVMPTGTMIFPVEKAPSPNGYDFVALGYWVDRGGPDKAAKAYLTKIKGTKIGLFGTLGAYPDSEHAIKAMANAETLAKTDNQVLGHFICMGKVDPALTERFKDLPPDHPHSMTPERMARHLEATKHPNNDDLTMAKNNFRAIVKDLVR